MATARNYLAGAGASAIFGLSFLFTKNALDSLSLSELLFFRFLAAALVMSLLVAARVVRLDYRGKPMKALLATAILQPVLYFIVETEGLKHADSSTAGIILSAIPVAVTALAAIFLGERLKRAQVFSTFLSFAGVVLVVAFRSYGRVGGSVLGILLLVGAMLCAAFFNIASRSASKRFSPAETTFFMMWFGALSFGALWAAESLVGGGTKDLLGRLNLGAIGSIAYLACLSSVVAFFLVNYNLSKLKSPEAAVFANLTTVVSVAAGLLFRGEALLWTDLAGGAMILAGIWLTNAFGAAGKRAVPKGN